MEFICFFFIYRYFLKLLLSNQKLSTCIEIHPEVELVELGTIASLGDALIPNCIKTMKYVRKLAMIEVSKDLFKLK